MYSKLEQVQARCRILQRVAAANFLRACFLLNGVAFCFGAHAQSIQVQLITSFVSDKCALTEIVINDVLVGHALRNLSGRLQDLDGISFSGFAQYFPPSLLVVRKDGEIDGLKVLVTTENSDKSATAISNAYQVANGKNQVYDLALVASVDPQKCSSTVSAVPSMPASYKTTPIFEQLFNGTPADSIGSFTKRIDVMITQPEVTEFSLDDHLFRRMGIEWKEERKGNLIATYDEFSRNLAGFDLRDRKKVKQVTPFGSAEVVRIVYAPSGFKFWQPSFGRDQFMEYRPYDVALLKAPRQDLRSTQISNIVTKSFIRKIVIDPVVDGQPIPTTSEKRLGFSDLVGGRTHALAFAMATDKLFSEDPSSEALDAGGFRLFSKLRVTARCQDNSIQSYSIAPLQTSFGKEGPLESEGKISIRPKVREQKTAGNIASLVINYEVTGRPHAAALPPFNLIRPRSCSRIWHAVEAKLSCSAGKLVTLTQTTGSQFPSRKTWINSVLKEDVDQGAFDRLWVCNANDSTRVE